MSEEMATGHSTTNNMHRGVKSGKTDCGFNTFENPTRWDDSHTKITRDKNGRKTVAKN